MGKRRDARHIFKTRELETKGDRNMKLLQELDKEVGSGMGDLIKSLAKPVAKLIGKKDCAPCEVRRVLLNAFPRLRRKYGLRRSVEIIKELAQEKPEEAARVLKHYLTLPEPLHIPMRRLFLKIACATGIAAVVGKVRVAFGGTYPGWGCTCYNNINIFECKGSTPFAMAVNVVPPSTN